MKNTSTDVTNHLVATMEMLNDPDMFDPNKKSTEEIASTLERAKAMSAVVGAYVKVKKVEVAAINAMHNTGFIAKDVKVGRLIEPGTRPRQ